MLPIMNKLDRRFVMHKARRLSHRHTRGADKSLARPGRKQAIATKLGIYSTYFPWSSIHVLARCSNFCKPIKKIRRLSVQPGLRGRNDLRVGRKMATFQLFYSVQGTGGSPTGPDPENRVGDQDIGNPGRPVSSASALGVGALSCKNKTPSVNFPRRFSFKMSFNCTSRDQ